MQCPATNWFEGILCGHAREPHCVRRLTEESAPIEKMSRKSKALAPRANACRARLARSLVAHSLKRLSDKRLVPDARWFGVDLMCVKPSPRALRSPR